MMMEHGLLLEDLTGNNRLRRHGLVGLHCNSIERIKPSDKAMIGASSIVSREDASAFTFQFEGMSSAIVSKFTMFIAEIVCDYTASIR